MSDKPSLMLVAQPQAFFHELITKVLDHQKLLTQPETEFYLVNLMNQFMTSERLYTQDADGGMKQEPLALLAKEALEASEPHQQEALFRYVGDVSLYTAGFFQDSLSRKSVDVDYYIDMGGTAYQRAATQVEEQVMKAVYEELARKFGAFVDVLAEVSEKTSFRTERDLLRIYDVWVRTRSGRAEKALQQAGILPNKTIKKDIQ